MDCEQSTLTTLITLIITPSTRQKWSPSRSVWYLKKRELKGGGGGGGGVRFRGQLRQANLELIMMHMMIMHMMMMVLVVMMMMAI